MHRILIYHAGLGTSLTQIKKNGAWHRSFANRLDCKYSIVIQSSTPTK